MADPIPLDVQQFILRYVDSIAQLEALLLLYGHPTDNWTVTAISQRLYITEQQTTELLARLQARDLIVAPAGVATGFRYQPQSEELAKIVPRVAEVYRQHLVPVTNLVHAKARLRVQEFADAFRLRKEEKD
jgi:hypothetical protein